MNKIIAFFLRIYLSARDALIADTSSIVSAFKKVEAKIEAAIENDHRKLDALVVAEFGIQQSKRELNSSVDAAYKLLHSVTELTK